MKICSTTMRIQIPIQTPIIIGVLSRTALVIALMQDCLCERAKEIKIIQFS